jgi:HPt (histidine-containing phosphotransfer) domain-containing protein
MDEPEVIDRAAFNNLVESVGGDQEFLGELLQTYFDDSPRQMEAMHAALAQGNAEDFRRAAHSLKSNSANFGAMALSRLAKGLEDLGKAGTLDGAAQGVAAAEQEYLRVRAALEAAARA